MRREPTIVEKASSWGPFLLAALPFATDFLSDPLDLARPRAVAVDAAVGVLLATLATLIQRRNRRIEESAITDRLTGLSNSRHLRVELDRQVSLARRTRSPLSAIFIDLDNLKAVNDRFGHSVGDRVLRRFAARLESAVRQDVDHAFRLGGDEFIVLCPQTPLQTGLEVARRIRGALRGVALLRRQGVTASLGVVELRRGERAGELLARADQAMYEAKREGKDRVGAA